MEEKRCYGCMKLKTGSPFCEHCGYDERASNGAHHLPVGTVLRGQYQVGRVLGQGGFGITYLGRDINLDMPIAIKEYYPSGMVMRDSSHSLGVTVVAGEENTLFAENRARFLREGQTLARLEDVPEVVQVKNFFVENNTAYIIMGYVKGITLKEHMGRKGGYLSAEETFRLLQPLVQAMGQVHALGLVHRDISPDNIMLQPNGRVRLIDFGAAHTATAGMDAKSTQAVLKHGFAPIEQYQSKGHLGSWTDVYAMCATIYCCLTGRQPPNVTDRMMGEEDFDWQSIPGLTAAQKEALSQGVELQYTSRIRSMEALYEKLFGRAESPVVPAPPQRENRPQPVERTIPVEESCPVGTVPLVRPRKEQAYTAPVQPEAYTAPVERTAPVQNATVPVARTAPVQDATVPLERSIEHKPVSRSRRGGKGLLVGLIAAVLICLALVVALWNPFATQSGTGMLMEAGNDAFRTGVLPNKIVSITFLNSTIGAPKEAVDASITYDGSVLAWTESNGTGYDLYIAADKGVIAPNNCSELFASYVNLEKIDFGNAFDTSPARDMSGMFRWCAKLEKLDVSGFDTGKVKSMQSMFAGCSSLGKLQLDGLDTAMVTDMSLMFSGCSSLKKLDVSDLDTGSVTTMQSMFEGCGSLEELDLSGFDTSRVTGMQYMFRYCSSLEQVDVASFDTSAVTNMSGMFAGTQKLLDVRGDFDVGNVISYKEFMDYGDTFNGEPSAALFDNGR